jgi:hypothetical protein
MTVSHAVLPDLNALDSDALKALVIEKHALVIEKNAELESKQNEIEGLKLLIAKLQRMQFGTSSERLARHIDQLELRLEDLETSEAAKPSSPPRQSVPSSKPARRPLSGDLPRETETFQPKETACPDCGGTLNHLGEDVSEMLEFVPGRFKVIRTVRPKLACKQCDAIVQAPAPHRPIVSFRQACVAASGSVGRRSGRETGQGLRVVPRHPLRGLAGEPIGVAKQGGQIVEGIHVR